MARSWRGGLVPLVPECTDGDHQLERCMECSRGPENLCFCVFLSPTAQGTLLVGSLSTMSMRHSRKLEANRDGLSRPTRQKALSFRFVGSGNSIGRPFFYPTASHVAFEGTATAIRPRCKEARRCISLLHREPDAIHARSRSAGLCVEVNRNGCCMLTLPCKQVSARWVLAY